MTAAPFLADIARVEPRLALVAADHAADLVAAWGARRAADTGARIAAYNNHALGARPKLFHEADGIAIIPVRGTLLNDWGCIDPWLGVTGYDGIALKTAAAVEDPDIRGIVYDINTGGGEVAGCEACARAIRAAGRIKPTAAILNECAYSAGYWLAAGTHSIAVPRTGGVGSIGVICLHVEVAGALKEAGITLTVLRAGERKAEGNPYEPLGDATRTDWLAELDAVRALFVGTVAEFRGLKPADLLATKARCIPAVTGEALTLGLADAVATPAEAWAAFAGALAGPSAA